MRIDTQIGCESFPCAGINSSHYLLPRVDVDPGAVSIVLISEAAPQNSADGYYAPAGSAMPLFAETTVQAFRDAGADVASIEEILGLGIYLTTAVKCGKVGYTIKAGPIKRCSEILEQELALFPAAKVYLLMGDVAIKAINYIAKRAGEGRVIPSGSTYKIRGAPYTFQGKHLLPSYLQAGPSFFIEKSKRKMIAEDIATALSLVA